MPIVGEESAIQGATTDQVRLYGGPRSFVPLRADPMAPDAHDAKRATFVKSNWSRQDDLRRHYHRQIEENIRMLSGQQWSMWHPLLQRWLDVTEWMSESERRWRLRPTFNRLLPWFMITLARGTESAPILTFVPGPDRIDAELAEAMDIAFKTLWREMGMPDVHSRVMAWVIAAGRGHFASRVDPNRGPMRKWVGRGRLPVMDPGTGDLAVDPNTGEQVWSENEYPNVPFGPDGTPFGKDGIALAVETPDGPMQIGDPHEEPEGRIVCDVMSPLEVRGTWGPQPWHEKPEHYTRQYLTPEQVYDQYGVDAEPEIRSNVGDVGELERLLYGTGFFNATSGNPAAQTSTGNTDGYIEVTTCWQAPKAYGGMDKRKDSPGGRLTAVTKAGKVLYDGVRPAAYPYTSNIRCLDFVKIPGRPAGTTPLESMVMPQRAYNRTYAQIGEHVNLCTNPKPIIDTQSGIQPGQWTNEPGKGFIATRRSGVPAVEWVSPPQLATDVFRYLEAVRQELEFSGQMAGAGGDPPTDDPSGELVKELRFNSDRYFGPTMRSAVEEYGRFSEDLQATAAVVWDEQKILDYTGEDNVARTMVVMPYMFAEGKVNVVPDAESMLPEGRGDRQARVYKMYMDGLFGLPGSPEARKMFFDLARFPHLSRTAKPGGVDRTMADQINGRLLQGEDPRQLPVFPWYDLQIHLGVLAEFMKSPEFLKQKPEIQAAFVFRWKVLTTGIQQQEAAAMQQQLQQQAMVAQAQNAGQGGAAEERGEQRLAPGTPAPPQGVQPQEMPTAAGSAA